MQPRIIAVEGSPAIRRLLHRIRAYATRTAAQINDVGTIRINGDWIVIDTLLTTESFSSWKRRAPSRSRVRGFSYASLFTRSEAGDVAGVLIRTDIDRDYQRHLVNSQPHRHPIGSRKRKCWRENDIARRCSQSIS